MLALLWLAYRNVLRNGRRAFLTAAGLGVTMFLFTTILTVLTTLDASLESAGRDPLLVVHHRGGLFHDLPESLGNSLRATEGVEMALGVELYGGGYGTTVADAFPSIGLETCDLRRFWGDELEVSDAALEAFRGSRTAALVGPTLMKRFGWRVGQRVTLRGSARPVDLTFEIAGTMGLRTEQGVFFFHREYLEEALGSPGAVNVFYVRARSMADVPNVATRIVEATRNSSDPIRAVAYRQYMEGLVAMIGDVRGAIKSVATMVIGALLLMVVNSIALSARERAWEIATMRAIGFGSGMVAVLVIMEATMLAGLGGSMGIVAARLMFGGGFAVGLGPLAGFRVLPNTMLLSLAVALLVGIAASLGPALRAARLPILETLRRMD